MRTRALIRLRARFGSERGSMLIELLIAMVFLATAVGALMTVYASSAISLSHAGIEGTGLTLVEKQMEKLRAGSYAGLALNSATIPAASDVYATDPPSNLTSTQRSTITSGQRTGGTVSATQLVTGPDNRQYRVDTYIFTMTPPSGQTATQVSVAARLVVGGTVGSIRARLVSTFDIGTTRDAT